MTKQKIKRKLEYLRHEIEAESISTSEILELRSLAKHIDKGDALLLEWAGVEEEQQASISIPLSEEDLQQLLDGESFDWSFPDQNGNNINVYLYKEEETE